MGGNFYITVKLCIDFHPPNKWKVLINPDRKAGRARRVVVGAPHAAIFCEAGHRFIDFVCSPVEQPKDHPQCPCGQLQAGFTYHYGGAPQGDPNECRTRERELRLLGTEYLLRRRWMSWRDANTGRKVRRRVLVSYFLEKYDITWLRLERIDRRVVLGIFARQA